MRWWQPLSAMATGSLLRSVVMANGKTGGSFPAGRWSRAKRLKWLCVEKREELATRISVGERLTTVEYDYPKFHLTMHCYLCTVMSGELTLLEHEAAKWLGLGELDSVRWLPADELVIERLKARAVEGETR